jgi:hypothetical protein
LLQAVLYRSGGFLSWAYRARDWTPSVNSHAGLQVTVALTNNKKARRLDPYEPARRVIQGQAETRLRG